MIPFGLHEGNRSEFLGWFAVSTIGFAIPIQRQSDQFGVDFIVHLAKRVQGKNAKGNRTDNMIATGKSFQLQIKSDEKPVVAEGDEAIDCLLRSTSPFFLGVVSKKEGRIRIYPTTNRLCFAGVRGVQRLQLIPGKADEQMVTPNASDEKIPLGKPIAEYDLDDLDVSTGKKEKRQQFFDVMYSWTVFEEWVLAWITDGMPFAAYPPKYDTNQPLDYDGLDVVHTDQAVHLPKLLRSLYKNMQLVSLYFQTLLDSQESGEMEQVRSVLGGDLKEIVTHCRQIERKASEMLDTQPGSGNMPQAEADNQPGKDE